jgi:LPS-assembly protein
VWRIDSRRRGFWCAFLLGALLAVRGGIALALDPEIEETLPVQVDAASMTYDRDRDVVIASGSVVVRYGETEVRADEVIVHRAIPLVEAHGNVEVEDPEGVLFADSVELNLQEETGLLIGAAIRSRRLQYALWGSRIEKFPGQSFRIVNGRFTTCRCESGAPSWSITAGELDVTVDGTGVAKDARFRILDVPVLYVPRALVPVQRERQSGFLFPRFGLSNERGMQTVLPFYWAIGPTREATLGFDLETSARIGGIAEYRYRSSRISGGWLSASYFNEFFRGDTGPGGAPKDRWSLAAEQVEAPGERLRVYSDAFVVSDDRFFREINTYAFERGRTIFFRTLPYSRSRLGATYSGARYLLGLEGQYYQDLTDPIESRTVQVAPRMQGLGQLPLRRWAVLDWGAEWSQFARGQGPAGSRFLAHPTVRFFAPTGPWVRSEVSLGFWGRAYALSETRPLAGGPDLPSTAHREQWDLHAEVSTRFERVYSFPHLGLQRVKHTVEPLISYTFIPATAQDELPFFDSFDRINRRNVLSFGATSRLLGRFSEGSSGEQSTAAQIRELGRVTLLQSADLSRQIPPLSSAGSPSHFSDVDVFARINPSRFLSFRWWGSFDVRDSEFSASQIALFVEDPRQPDEAAGRRLQTRTSAGVAYRLLANNVLQQVDGNVVLRLTDWAGVTYATRYNVPARRFLENYAGLRLLSRCDCWSVDLAVSNRTNPAETEARLQFTLVGLSEASTASRVAVSP